MACAMLGVDFVGMELDEHYLREAVARTRHALEGRVTAPSRRQTRAARAVSDTPAAAGPARKRRR